MQFRFRTKRSPGFLQLISRLGVLSRILSFPAGSGTAQKSLLDAGSFINFPSFLVSNFLLKILFNFSLSSSYSSPTNYYIYQPSVYGLVSLFMPSGCIKPTKTTTFLYHSVRIISFDSAQSYQRTVLNFLYSSDLFCRNPFLQ